MKHAVIARVKMGPDGRTEEGRQMLETFVVPAAKSQPGFVRGTWLNNGAEGCAVVVFDDEEHARSAVDQLKPPPGGPTLLSAEVFAVEVEA